MQNLHLRGVLPPLVALLAGAGAVGVAAAVLPAAGLVLAARSARRRRRRSRGSRVRSASRGARRQAAAAGSCPPSWSSYSRAPELVAYGHEDARLERVRAPTASCRAARRDALAGGIGDGLGLVVAGVTVAGVLAAAVAAHGRGALDRVLIAMLALLALASFEAVQPLSAAARELAATLAAGRRVLELIDASPR